MDFNDYLTEFCEFDNEDKFSYSCNIRFEDGTSIFRWFIKNKDLIFSSEDARCLRIKYDYLKRKTKYEERRRREKQASINAVYYKKALVKEFAETKGFEKFNYSSDMCFQNGDNMSKWFYNNMNNILDKKDSVSLEVKRQFEVYEKRKKEKLLLEEKKKKLLFYKEKSLEKFDDGCELVFSDNTKYNVWFYGNIESIFLSKSPLDIEILKQYTLYMELNKLKLEFLEISDLDKFDLYGNVRFKSGALACMFFETHEKSILSSKSSIDKMIKEQYDEYCILKKKV